MCLGSYFCVVRTRRMLGLPCIQLYYRETCAIEHFTFFEQCFPERFPDIPGKPSRDSPSVYLAYVSFTYITESSFFVTTSNSNGLGSCVWPLPRDVNVNYQGHPLHNRSEHIDSLSCNIVTSALLSIISDKFMWNYLMYLACISFVNGEKCFFFWVPLDFTLIELMVILKKIISQEE